MLILTRGWLLGPVLGPNVAGWLAVGCLRVHYLQYPQDSLPEFQGVPLEEERVALRISSGAISLSS